MSTKVKTKPKILIIRFSSIGDIVLTTPVVRCLKKQLNAEIHYLTKSSYASILAYNPYIDIIHTINNKVAELSDKLKSEAFDYIIDLHKNIRSKKVKLALSASYSTFDKVNWQKWLMVNFKINKLPAIHIVDRYFGAVNKLGVSNDGKGLDYFLPKAESFNVELHQKIQVPKKYIAFSIGGAHATKRFPNEKVVEVLQAVPYPVVLLGGPSEKSDSAWIVNQLEKTPIIDTCGKLSLHESAYVAKNAQVLISNDTGLMHIGAAFQVPIIALWGNTIPEFGMYPYYETGKAAAKNIQVENLSCRPCSKIGFDKCPKGHFKCMNEISVEDIVAAVQGAW